MHSTCIESSRFEYGTAVPVLSIYRVFSTIAVITQSTQGSAARLRFGCDIGGTGDSQTRSGVRRVAFKRLKRA